jgi:hypothetical protein
MEATYDQNLSIDFHRLVKDKSKILKAKGIQNHIDM